MSGLCKPRKKGYEMRDLGTSQQNLGKLMWPLNAPSCWFFRLFFSSLVCKVELYSLFHQVMCLQRVIVNKTETGLGKEIIIPFKGLEQITVFLLINRQTYLCCLMLWTERSKYGVITKIIVVKFYVPIGLLSLLQSPKMPHWVIWVPR